MLLLLLMFSFSCKKDFENINKDPEGFTTPSDGAIFNAIINSLRLGADEQFYINYDVLYKETQLSTTYSMWGNTSIGTENIWKRYYTSLPNIRKLEENFKSYENTPAINNMRAMVKIVLAYKTFTVTDLFGDIPFFEAGKGFINTEYLHPKFDNQRSIYLFLLDELKWADENIDVTAISEPFTTFAKFDMLFNGDLTKWRKFCNSLRLRYAMRMYNKEPDKAGAIIKDIIENNKDVLLGCTSSGSILAESACMFPYLQQWKNEWRINRLSAHEYLRMGSNVWHLMSENDSIDGSGIFDIRTFFFFETNNARQWKPYPQIPNASTPSEGGIPYKEQRDNASGYFVKDANCLYSPLCYFLWSDKDNTPEILMTGAEVHFIKAEAYLRGIGVAYDELQAITEFYNGITASVNFWINIANRATLKDGTKFYNATTGTYFEEMVPSSFVPLTAPGKIMDHYDMWVHSTYNERIKFIYTQCMLDMYMQPQEAFALARRTMLTPREGVNISYYRFTIPESEVEYNYQNWLNSIGGQGDYTTTKVWWMN